MKGIVIFTAALMVFASAVLQSWAQDEPIPYPEPTVTMLSSAELDQLLEPIALYPDPLIAQILPAATQPSQIALAASYINQGGDPNLIEQQPWDSSVKALAYYPDVLNMMNGNLQWTAQLGQAFITQPDDVMNAIQSLRAQAQNLGNLQSTPEQYVVSDNGIIEILPANPQIIYVPIYQPSFVFFQRPYGRHFVSYGHGFRTGYWLNHDFDWHDHNVIVWDRDHPRPDNWWREKPSQRLHEVVNRAQVWRPRQQNRPANSPVWGQDRGYARPVTQRPVTTESHPPQPRPPQARPAEPRPAQPRPTEPKPTEPIPPQAQPTQPRSPVEAQPVPTRPPVQHPAQAPVQHPATVPTQRSPSGAFSGPQAARDMRAASSRGQESRQTVNRPVPTPAPAPRPSGGSSGGSNRNH